MIDTWNIKLAVLNCDNKHKLKGDCEEVISLLEDDLSELRLILENRFGKTKRALVLAAKFFREKELSLELKKVTDLALYENKGPDFVAEFCKQVIAAIKLT